MRLSGPHVAAKIDVTGATGGSQAALLRRLTAVIVGIVAVSGPANDAHAGQPVVGVSARGGFLGGLPSAAIGGEIVGGYALSPVVRLLAVVGYDRSFSFSDDDDQYEQGVFVQAGARLAWPTSWVVRPFADLRLGLLLLDEVFPKRWTSVFAATTGLGLEVGVHKRVAVGVGAWLTLPIVGSQAAAQLGLTATWLLGDCGSLGPT